jgi:hypothetical protein
LKAWSALIDDFKTKTSSLVNLLAGAGKISEKDKLLIQTVLEAANLEKITNPNVVGQ